MALLSSMEVINFLEYLETLVRIFDAADVSWTLATNSGSYHDPSQISRGGGGVSASEETEDLRLQVFTGLPEHHFPALPPHMIDQVLSEDFWPEL